MTDAIQMVFPEIKTERLTLREIVAEDIGAIFDIFSNEEVMKCYGQFPMQSTDESERVIAMFDESFKSGKGIRWGIARKEDNKIIGTCGYHNWNKRHSRAEIGYELSPQAWGQGYIQEALKAIIPYGYREMELNRIEAVVYPENEASKKSLISQGFKEEGLLQQYAFFRGVFQDLIMFSCLKKNWIAS